MRSAHNPERELERRGTVYFFRYNSLKSSGSPTKKRIQGNASFFPWIYLDELHGTRPLVASGAGGQRSL